MSKCPPETRATATAGYIAGCHPTVNMAIGQSAIHKECNVDHNHNFPKYCVNCHTNHLNHKMDALYSGHSQTYLDSSKKQIINVSGSTGHCSQFSSASCRECGALPCTNQSAPNLNTSGVEKVRQDPMLSSQLNVISQRTVGSDQHLDQCSRLETALSCCCNRHQNEMHMCNFNFQSNGDHLDKQSLMPSAPNIAEWPESQQIQQRQSEQNGFLRPKRHKQRIEVSLFNFKVAGFFSVVCNIGLTAVIAYMLLYNKKTHPQPPIPGNNHSEPSYANLDSAVCFSATNELRFDSRFSIELESGHGTKFICRTDIKYLKWILILMQIIRNYSIYINPQPIGSQKHIINTAHARISANCSKGCSEALPLLLEDFQPCHGSCRDITVDKTGIHIPVDGYYLVFSQFSYDSKNSLDGEKLSVDILQNTHTLAKKTFPVSSGYGGVNMLFVVKLRQGDVLKPGMSNTKLFYSFRTLNFMGIVQLSPENSQNGRTQASHVYHMS